MMLWEPKIFFWARAVIQEQGSCAIEGRASTHEQFVMTQWSPAFMMPETTAIVAAMPVEKHAAPCPFSRIAILFSRAVTVGLFVREYEYLCSWDCDGVGSSMLLGHLHTERYRYSGASRVNEAQDGITLWRGTRQLSPGCTWSTGRWASRWHR